jgi:hypothetical protein
MESDLPKKGEQGWETAVLQAWIYKRNFNGKITWFVSNYKKQILFPRTD